MRLIDLQLPWLLQYTAETTTFPPTAYPSILPRLTQIEGYLQTTSAAVITCARSAEDWASQVDPWRALLELVARVEAEFPGRILIGPDDLDRWLDEPTSLTWAVLGVEGWEGWLNSSGDLERLAVLFERGVRVFGLPRLAEDQEIAVLETLAGLAQGRPIAAVDLSRLDEPALDRVLTWFEADADRPRRLVPIVARGAVAREGFAGPGVISIPKLSRLRALGGILGLGVTSPWVDDARQLLTAVELAATLPFQGRVGPQGLALATGFLEAEATLPGLGSAPEVVAWVKMALGEPLASALLFDNARALVERLAGGR